MVSSPPSNRKGTMADSMYLGMDDEASPSETPDTPDNPKEDKDEGETALLPKSFFEGQELKPGEQYYVEIVRSYEDEVLVKYPHKIKDEEPEESANSKLEAMGSNPGDSGRGY